MNQPPAIDRIPVARSVIYAVRGVPEVAEEYNPERTIVPTELTLHYRAAPDSQLGRVSAYVKGWWKQDGKRIPMDKPVGRWFYGGPDGWPAWLAEEVRLHDPEITPADPAALRDRIAEALLDHLARTADIRTGRNGELAFMPEVTDTERLRMADAIAAGLPAPVDRAELDSLGREADRLRKAWVGMRDRAERIEAEVERLRTDRAAVLNEAADALAALRGASEPEGGYDRGTRDALIVGETKLRRMADEAQQQVACTCGGPITSTTLGSGTTYEEHKRTCAVMADKAQQPECSASRTGHCLREAESETACDTEASECVHGGRHAVEAQPAQPQQDGLRCVCGDPVQLMDDNDPTSWIHSPGSDTRCLHARPRCPHCQMPHAMTPQMFLMCASIRASIRDRDGAEAQQDGAAS
ncbi:MAG: hypothetical protein HOV82_10115 [Streptomyces sp.]|nr:hypothetical protein [Streptomyces sp.]